MSAHLLIVFNFPKGCSEGQGTLEVDDGGVSNSNLMRLMELAGYILHILSCCLSHQPFCNKDPSQSSCIELPFIGRWTDGYQSAGLRWSGGNSLNLLLWVWHFSVGPMKVPAPVEMTLGGFKERSVRGFRFWRTREDFCCCNFDIWSQTFSVGLHGCVSLSELHVTLWRFQERFVLWLNI